MSRPQRATNAFALWLTVYNSARRPRALLDEIDQFSKMPGAHRAFVRTLQGIASPLRLKDIPEFEADARAMRAPILVVSGDRDRIFPLKQSERVRELMPQAHLEVMNDVGHFPQIDSPATFVAMVAP